MSGLTRPRESERNFKGTQMILRFDICSSDTDISHIYHRLSRRNERWISILHQNQAVKGCHLLKCNVSQIEEVVLTLKTSIEVLLPSSNSLTRVDKKKSFQWSERGNL